MLQQKKGWGKNVIVMYTCKDNLTPLLYSGKIKKNYKKKYLIRMMEGENLILSEVSQKEKDKYHMISLISGM